MGVASGEGAVRKQRVCRSDFEPLGIQETRSGPWTTAATIYLKRRLIN